MTSTMPLVNVPDSPASPQPAELFLRSLHADWGEERWAALAHDTGLRYEVIDGVLYMSTAPSPEHQ